MGAMGAMGRSHGLSCSLAGPEGMFGDMDA